MASENGPNVDPVVAAALAMLTEAVNDWMLHANDRARMPELFQRLRAGGYDYDPAEVQRWAIQNGWRADNAEELRQQAVKAKSVPVTEIEPDWWDENSLEQWEDAAVEAAAKTEEDEDD